MAEVVIFGGTTEGRELAEYAASLGIFVLVSVVSEYGKMVMEERPCLRVRCGALDEDGMACLLEREKPRLVFDATHPHASEATAGIFRACERTKIRLLRVLRAGTETGRGDLDGQEPVFWVHTIEEAVKILERDTRPVLLTTGSKELDIFAAAVHLKGRIYARVLPDSKVLEKCENLGIRGRHLIAMQGAFSEEMNRALLREVKAGWLVTKESGCRGGFEEKMKAAKSCNVSVIVIERPNQEQGISIKEAREELQKLSGDKRERGQIPGRHLSLIGMGMGTGSQLTQEALEELGRCSVIFGAPRMLEDIRPWIENKHREELYLGREVFRWFADHSEYERGAVVYSGDTGFYSGCHSLLRELQGKAGENFSVKVFPGISTLSCLCARLGRSWEGIHPASIHGRDCDVEGLLRKYNHVFLLLGGEENLGSLSQRLIQAGMGKAKMSAGVRLGYPNERILTGTAEKFTGPWEDLLAAVILDWDEEERL